MALRLGVILWSVTIRMGALKVKCLEMELKKGCKINVFCGYLRLKIEG